MSSDKEDIQFQEYKNDPRIACQYGVKCYQRNPQHHSKYKHPPRKETVKQQTKKLITGIKRKNPIKDDKTETQSESLEFSPQKKLQRTQKFPPKNIDNLFSNLKEDDTIKVNEDNKDSNIQEIPDENIDIQMTSLNECDHSSDLAVHNINDSITSISNLDAQKIILDLFLVEMPNDFFQLYNFCENVSKSNPTLAFKSASLILVGPYDVLNGKIKNIESEEIKEKYLTHWRYYYDPPEFQTIIKCDDKKGLHFGYWRDNATEKPVFVAKNYGNVNGIFESIAENIFGALDAYLQDKVKLANPFEKTNITRLLSQLKNFAKKHNITLEKKTANMRLRERKVVTRTFHRAGIVVPYDNKTQLGYRDLAATDNDLQKILKQIEEATTPDERKPPIMKLDEIMRLATIAADECDFGTCLELGHDLFSNGGIHVQNRALQMLSIAYSHLQRLQLLKIFKAHLKNRKRGCELSVI